MNELINKITSDQNDRRLILIILMSLFVKLFIIVNASVVNGDAVRYFNSANQIFHGNVTSAFEHEKMLVYTFTLGLFQLIFHDWVLSGYVLSLVFLTLTLVPLYFFTKEIFGANAATWTAIAFSLIPAINELTSNVVKDAPFLFFIMAAMWVGRKALVNNHLGCFLLTFSCGILATLFRFEGIVFLCVYSLWLLFNALFRPVVRPVARRGMLIFAGIPAVCLVVISGLFLSGFFEPGLLKSVWLRFKEHYFQLELLDNYHAIYNHLKTVERSFPGGQWTHDFFEIARYNLPLIYLVGMFQILVSAIFPFYLVPLYFGLKSAKFSEKGAELLGWAIVAYLIMAYFFIVTRNFLAERYLVIVVVMLLPLVGHGFERLRELLPAKRFRTIVNVMILICFLCLPLYRTFAETRDEKNEIRLAGEWLKNNGKTTYDKLMTTDERITFYAGLWRGEYEIFPDSTGQAFETVASEGNSSIMILDLPSRDVTKLPEFEKYMLIKEFRGEKKTVLIYERKS